MTRKFNSKSILIFQHLQRFYEYWEYFSAFTVLPLLYSSQIIHCYSPKFSNSNTNAGSLNFHLCLSCSLSHILERRVPLSHPWDNPLDSEWLRMLHGDGEKHDGVSFLSLYSGSRQRNPRLRSAWIFMRTRRGVRRPGWKRAEDVSPGRGLSVSRCRLVIREFLPNTVKRENLISHG